MALRVDQVEEQMAARIAALDASTYNQHAANSSMPTLAWTEAETVLSADEEGRGVSHLRFQVLASDARAVRDRQLPNGPTRIVSSISVVFMYHIRPTKQKIDQRLAARAATDVVRAIKALPQNEWSASLSDAWRPAMTEDGEWLVVEVVFTVMYEMPV